MEITSVSYILFVLLSVLVYWNIPFKYRWYILLLDSLIFYFVNAQAYTFLYIIISVTSVYGATQYFESGRKNRKTVLILTLSVNLIILVLLKYTNLFIGTVNYLCHENIENVSWYASLAISFYTLQIISYLLDCYWNVDYVEKNPLKLLLFTSFFPLMVSGPISQHAQLAPQLFEPSEFCYARIATGVRRIAWGIAKKVIVADRLAVVVAYLFKDPDTFSGVWVMIAAVLFVVELYFDFSGCMDIVIGVSECFGIALVENFKAPFLSRTVQEIWQRWHITLGLWLKSYVMYPLLKSQVLLNFGSACKKKLGKKAGKKVPVYAAMFVVWLLMGIWHGNSWKYVVGEGLWFWFVIVMEQILEPFSSKLRKVLHMGEDSKIWRMFQCGRTIILFSIGMIFFYSTDLPAAIYMLSKIFVISDCVTPFKLLINNVGTEFGGKSALWSMGIICALQVFVDVKTYRNESVQEILLHFPIAVRWLCYIGFVYLIILEGVFGKSSFIYFGF